jgi:hypothetical protein
LGQTNTKTVNCRMESNDVVTLIRGAVKSGRRTDDVIDAKSTFWASFSCTASRYELPVLESVMDILASTARVELLSLS